jgi:glycosyltransferase involved in cell wall biosynthesis
VTPSLNQGRFIEETIRSLLLQGYSNLEYFVIDGGSTDNSVEIIRKYSSWIDFWVSEPDAGQSAAINRGLKMGSGSLATWINSDDMLCQHALASHFTRTPLAEPTAVYIGDCVNIDEAGKVLFTHRGWVRSLEDLVRVRSVWHSGGSIDQPAVLFPLELALRVGGLDEANHHTMDYELWGKFFLAGAEVRYTEVPFGCFRWQGAQKTQESEKQSKSMFDVAETLITRANSMSPQLKQELLEDLAAYRIEHSRKVWKESGRLARLGLPPAIVLPLRRLLKVVTPS